MITNLCKKQRGKGFIPAWTVCVGIWLCSCFLITGCRPEEFNSADDLKVFINEPSNNLKQHVSLNGYDLTVSYKPIDLLVYQETGGEPTDYQRLYHLEKKYEGNYYFVMTFTKSMKDSSSSIEVSQLQNFSTSISRYLSLTTMEDDTIEADGFTIERINTVNDATEILFVLSKEKSKAKDWIQFNLNEFGLGLGNRTFKFHIEDLEQVPKLKFALIS